MADGGFLIKFDGKEIERCYAVAFDYDEWVYAVNEEEATPIPGGVKKIEIIVETE